MNSLLLLIKLEVLLLLLTEAEDTKWQEYTEELYKKVLNTPDNHDGVITHLEPDILGCEVKWALESITTNKLSGGDGVPVELFQILLVKCCTQHASKFGKLSSGHRTVFISIPKKGNAKECSSYCTNAFISHASKVMLKILQARLQQYMNRELPDVLVLEKAEEPEIKLPTSAGSLKKQKSSRKTSTFALLTTPNPLTVWITNSGKLLKRCEYQTTCLPPEKSVHRSISNS